ncbi:hypothetical protein XspCFBP7912_03415 [Xanthomonas sp. CFBP 7912]|nr:hypothetical protein XspCFBP7912_03415 [Xanthomonas sp. CFBP 7912]
MPEVRTAALEFASAKGHGRVRSPYRECRNAKQCKVCDCCSASSASGRVIEPVDQLAGALQGDGMWPAPTRVAAAAAGTARSMTMSGPLGYPQPTHTVWRARARRAHVPVPC